MKLMLMFALWGLLAYVAYDIAFKKSSPPSAFSGSGLSAIRPAAGE